MDMTDILVIGGGGREHAIVRQCRQSPRTRTVYAWPGNAGMRAEAEAVPVKDWAGLADWAEAKRPLVVIGPEQPLAEGWADRLRARGLKVVGPSQAAARLEASKGWAKALMREAGVPTAEARRLDSPQALAAAVESQGEWPVVVKQDGLAQGKGVVVLRSPDQARALAAEWGRRPELWENGVLWERFLVGRECSALLLTDGRRWAWLPPARDYKQLGPRPEDPNTGGMGGYAPVPWLSLEDRRRIDETIIGPTLAALRRRGIVYQGFLYAGLMITGEGPMVLEWNVRLGDPEAQSVLPLLASDLVEWLAAVAEGSLPAGDLAWRPAKAVTVVVAAAGYPDRPHTGSEFPAPSPHAGVHYCYAGVEAAPSGRYRVSGGRVLAATALAQDFAGARAAAYRAADAVALAGKQVRRDIAIEVLAP
jgi:phosphoribosylamine--glycine ligase